MGLFKSFADAVGGTLADQWKDIYTAPSFSERLVVGPGEPMEQNNRRGSNLRGSEGIITNGSRIFVPEGTAAFIFSQGSIEEVIPEPGEYEYEGGTGSVFSGDGLDTILDQVEDRFKYGGILPDKKYLAFVNLREVRGIKFGTMGPQIYHDGFYDTDLEVTAFGSYSVKVTDPERFVKEFLPANVNSYSFDDERARSQMQSEFVHSFVKALNGLSAEYRISQLPGRSDEIAQLVERDSGNAGAWPERFGFALVAVAVENIQLTPESRELVQHFAANKMDASAYEGVSQEAANRAAQQKIARGIQDNGLGEGGGMVFGMNLAQGVSPTGAMPGVAAGSSGAGTAQVGGSQQQAAPRSIDDDIETLKKLKELLDAGILTQEEFDAKKQQVMGL